MAILNPRETDVELQAELWSQAPFHGRRNRDQRVTLSPVRTRLCPEQRV